VQTGQIPRYYIVTIMRASWTERSVSNQVTEAALIAEHSMSHLRAL